MYKMKLYLSITDDLIDEVDSKWKYAKKARQISQELTALLAQAETDRRQRREAALALRREAAASVLAGGVHGHGGGRVAGARRL